MGEVRAGGGGRPASDVDVVLDGEGHVIQRQLCQVASDAGQALGLIQNQKVTLFFGVPTFYATLLNSTLPDDAFASVRWGVSAGEALPPTLNS